MEEQNNEQTTSPQNAEQPARPSPESTPEENVEKPDAPVEESQTDAEQPDHEEVSAPSRDEFNCPDCSGEGLKDQYALCPSCNGTGKR